MSKSLLLAVILGAVISTPSFAQERDKATSTQILAQNALNETSKIRVSAVKNSVKLSDILKLPTKNTNCTYEKLAEAATCKKVGGTVSAPVCAGTCGTCDMTYDENNRAVCRCL